MAMCISSLTFHWCPRSLPCISGLLIGLLLLFLLVLSLSFSSPFPHYSSSTVSIAFLLPSGFPRPNPTKRLPLTARRCLGAKCAGFLRRGISPSDLVRRARSKVFHLNCFTCMMCNKQLSTGNEALHHR